MEIIDVNRQDCVMTPLNIDFREHSRNSLENAAGEELQLVGEQRSRKRGIGLRIAQQQVSKYREHSQKLWDNGKPTDCGNGKKTCEMDAQ